MQVYFMMLHSALSACEVFEFPYPAHGGFSNALPKADRVIDIDPSFVVVPEAGRT